MSDLAYLAIALAVNPNLADELRKNPESATESVGLRLSSEELGKLTNILDSLGGRGGLQPPSPKPLPTKVQPTHLASATRHKLDLSESGKQKVVDNLAPLILDSISASGLQLSPAEMERVKTDIQRGLEVNIPGAGPLAKVSGNVAGSITVDW
jgi:hypothetical protein